MKRLRDNAVRLMVGAGLVAAQVVVLPIVSEQFSSVVQAADPPVQTFYTPIKEAQLLPILNQTSGNAAPVSPMHTVLSMVASRDATVIYYDHWEDGFEADLANPVQSTTLVLGDGIASNGCAGTYFPTPVLPCSDADDLINAGDILNNQEDNIVIPRDPATVLWDGGDKIGASRTIAMTRSSWASGSNTLMGDATEIYDTTFYGLLFTFPVGEGWPDPPPVPSNPPYDLYSNELFENTVPMVMASADNTTISLDYDGDGTIDASTTLNEGQAFSAPLAANIFAGGTVTADKPVQVQLLTGNDGENYAFDGFTLFPTERWSDSYYTPVSRTCSSGASTGPEDSHVWLHNPNAGSITVFYEDFGSSGSIILRPGETLPYETVNSTGNNPSGSHFYTTDGSPFGAVGTMDSDLPVDPVATPESNTAWDWGYTLIPETSLSTAVIVGWGPGRDPTSPTNPTENGNPIWVTPVAATRVYVDFDGNPLTGALTDPAGGKYDQHYDLNALDSRTVYDDLDKDQTGTRVYTTDGTLIAVAWGQDVCRASASAPGLDVGTAVLPLASLDFSKQATLANDLNGNGIADQGDTLLYTLSIFNISNVTATNIRLEDTPDPNTTYVPGSTVQTVGAVTSAVPDGLSGTAFPLDDGGISFAGTTLAPLQSITVTFLATVNSLPNGVTSVTNSAVVTSNVGVSQARVTTPVRIPAFEVTKVSNPENNPLQPGDTVDYTIQVTNTSNTTQTGVTVSDPLPTGTAYVPGSTFINAPSQPIRATEYYIGGGDGFDGTSYDLVLDRDLATDYFVIIQGSSTLNDSGPRSNYVRVTRDPFGTGDLNTSTAPNVIRLEREFAVSTWIGVVTVVESITNQGTDGFNLLDVQSVAHPGTTTSGTDTSGTAWSNINKVLLMGGFNGAGCTTLDDAKEDHGTCQTRLFPSLTNTINWERNAASVKNGLTDATSTVMVVEWGSNWTVQRRNVVGSAGGDKIDVVGEYDTAAISPVARDNTWVWGTGTMTSGNGDQLKRNGEGQVITLGDGVTQNATESVVAVGGYQNHGRSFDVYAMTHPELKVDYRFKPDGDPGLAVLDVAVDSTASNRMAIAYTGNNAGDSKTPSHFFSARFVNSTTVRLEQQRTNNDWAAWVQAIGFSAVKEPTTNIPGGAPPTLATGYTLEPGQTMTVTFSVTVNNPPPAGLTQIVNTVNVTSDQDDGPNEATVTDDLGSVIGDTIWYDLDGDGVQDVGETGIAGVTVTLTPPAGVDLGNGFGVAITTTTDANGYYKFVVQDIGTYTVTVDAGTLPTGLTATGDPDETGTCTVCDGTTTATITAVGDVVLTADFGYQPSGTISGTIYDDLDTSYDQDTGEPALEFVEVGLYYADGVTQVLDSAGNPLTVLTDENGFYEFTDLPGGDYVVVVNPNSNSLPALSVNYEDPDATPPTLGDSQTAVTLPSGGAVVEQNFGYDNPDLFTKAVDETTALPGDKLTYTMGVSYPGNELLSNVVVSDVIPDGTSYAGNASPVPTSQPTIGSTGGTVTWNLGSNTARVDGSVAFSPGGVGTFSTPVQRDSAAGNSKDQLPVIAVGPSGQAYMAFNKNGNRTYFNRTTSGTWGTATLLPLINGETQDKNVDIAVGGDGVIHVVIDNEGKNVFYLRSTDGGATWSTPLEIDRVRGAGTATDSSDHIPRLFVDSANTPHVLFGNGTGDNSTYYTRRNSDGTWITPVALPQINAENKDRAFDFAVDSSGNIHVVIDNENKNVYYLKGTVVGGVWTSSIAPKEIDTAAGDGADRLPKLVIDSFGTVHVMFVDNTRTYYTRSTNGGATFSTPTVLPQFFAEDKDRNVDFAVDYCGNIHAVVDNENRNVFYTLGIPNPTTGVVAWGTPIEIGNSVGSDGTDRNPVVAVSGTTVYVAFGENGENVYTTGASIVACTPATTTSLGAGPTLVQNGDTVTITMTVTAGDLINSFSPVTGITPTTPTVVNATGSAACTSITPLDVAPKSITTAGGSATFTWTCAAGAGTSVPAGVAFRASATGTSRGVAVTFAQATSNSVLMPPDLSYQATVDASPFEPVVVNQALWTEDNVIGTAPSNVVKTVVNTTDAQNDINQTPVNTPVSGSVATNDTDLQGDNQTVTSALVDTDGDGLVDETLPIGVRTQVYGTNDAGALVVAGHLTLNADGTYLYEPALDFTGTVPAEYTITDDNTKPATDTATLTIEVFGPTVANPDPPVAQDDTNTTEVDIPVSNNVIAPNDTDPENQVLTVTSVLMDTDGDGLADDPVTVGVVSAVYGTDVYGNVVPAGTLVINSDGSYTFDPNATFVGDVPSEYTITDTDALSDSATLTITIVPDRPNSTFTNDDANAGPEDLIQTGNILDNDNDPEGDDQDVTLIDTNGDGIPDTAPVAGTPIDIFQGGVLIGTLTIDPETGAYIWDPVPGYIGTAVVPYTVEDEGHPTATDTATLYLTTYPVNSTDAQNDINQTPINTPVSGSVATNDTDPEGDNQTVTSALVDTDGDGLVDETLPIGVTTAVYGTNDAGAIVPAGTLTLNADGTYDYVPATDFTGTVPAAYTVTDDNGDPATDDATLTIEVFGPTAANPDPPVAQDDTNTTEVDIPVSDNVITPNDYDPENQVLTVTSVLMDTDGDGLADDPVTVGVVSAVYGTDVYGNVVPAGTLVINSDGSYTFDPNATFVGDVPSEYTITDTDALSDSATLTITIVPDEGNSTFANDDANAGPEDLIQTGNILDNDNDVEGDDQDVTLIDTNGDGIPDTAPVAGTPIDIFQGGALIGTLTIDPETGAYIWDPVPGYIGTAVVPYTVNDDGSPVAADTATLYLTTYPLNSTDAQNDINQTPINTPVSGSVATNDTDSEGDNQTVTSALVDTDGDGLVDETLPIGVTTAVYGTNDAGAIVPAGTLTLYADGTYDYVPATGFTGTVPAIYTVTDDNGDPATDTATLTIEVFGDYPLTNDPPVAQDDTNTTEVGVPVSANVIDPNDSDPDRDAVTGAGDTLTVVGDVLYDTDGDGLVDDPVIVGTPTTVYGTDPTGAVVPAGTLVVNADGTYTFTPNGTFVGDVQAEYTISDDGTTNAGHTDSAILTITVVPNDGNDTDADDDAYTSPVNTTVNADVSLNDFDNQGHTQTVTSALFDTDGDGLVDDSLTIGVATPVYSTVPGELAGTLTLKSDGTLTFDPALDWTGTVPGNYTVTDSHTEYPATASADVTIVIYDKTGDDAPIAGDDAATTSQTDPTSGDVLGNDADPDGGTLTVTAALVDTDGDGLADDTLTLGTPTPVYGLDSTGSPAPAGTIVLNSAGTYTFTPNGEFDGTVPVDYTASDGTLTDTATLTIGVAPTEANSTFANDDASSSPQDVNQTGNILANDHDAEGEDQDVTLIDTNGDGIPDTAPVAGTPLPIFQGGVQIGTLEIDPETGAYTWDPVPTYIGTAVVPYTVTDGEVSDTATLYLTTYPGIDYDDTPTSYGNAGALIDASLHLGDGAFLADGVTQDATLPGDDADTDDGTVIADATIDGGGYTLTFDVTNTTGQSVYLCGWIDLDKLDGFETSERVCVEVPAGATTADLTWSSVGGLTGMSWSRFRLASTLAEAQSPTGGSGIGEIEDYPINLATLPITVAYVSSSRVNGKFVDITWWTGMETGNAGFLVYGDDGRGGMAQLSEFVPGAGDSSRPLGYATTVKSAAEQFWLVDIDLRGARTVHGPYGVGETVGSVPDPILIDWADAAPVATADSSKIDGQAAPGGGGGGGNKPDGGGKPGGGKPGGGGGGAPIGSSAVLDVVESGLHRVTFADLLAAGLDWTGTATGSLAVIDAAGAPVPVATDGTSSFAPGGWVEFYGESVDTLYTGTNVYRLVVDPKLVVPMAVDSTRVPKVSVRADSTYLHTEVFEEQIDYSRTNPGDDPWYWVRPTSYFGWSTSTTVTVDLVDLVPGAGSLSVDLWGGADSPGVADHQVSVLVNGTPVGAVVFDGLSQAVVEVAVPSGVLRDGANSVTITLAGAPGSFVDWIYLDSITVSYQRSISPEGPVAEFEASSKRISVAGLPDGDLTALRFDGAGVTRISRLAVAQAPDGTFAVSFAGTGSGAGYLVASRAGVLRPRISLPRDTTGLLDGAADLLIISHSAFSSSVPLRDLVDARERGGLSVKVVEVEDLYASYTGGVIDPSAISAYITAAAAAFGDPAVLLVGGDTEDYRNYRRLGSISYIPTIYGSVGVGDVKWSPIDPAYVDLDGDRVPDLPLGRFPVRSLPELERVIAKTLSFDNDGSAIFTADVGYGAHSDAIAAALGSSYSVQKAYLDQVDVTTAHQQLIGAINAGVALNVYFGHSDLDRWATHDLLKTADTAVMTNSSDPNLTIQFGCWNTYFVDPVQESLGSALLTSLGGSAAVLGATTLTSSVHDAMLGSHLGDALATSATIGEALTAAKQGLASVTDAADISLGWTLLGDPTLPIQVAGS